jgi:hypothetical protein
LAFHRCGQRSAFRCRGVLQRLKDCVDVAVVADRASLKERRCRAPVP